MTESHMELGQILPEFQIDLEQVTPQEAEKLLMLVPLNEFIVYVHRTLLHRSPVAGSLDAQTSRGGTRRNGSRQIRAQIISDLMASADFLNRHGRRHKRTAPIDAFVREAYLDLLGRNPDAGGMQTYSRLGQKFGGRRRIERALRNSAEGRSTGGGRQERILALKRLVSKARQCRIPIFGSMLANKLDWNLRLLRIELTLGALFADQSNIDPANGVLSQLSKSMSSRLGISETDQRLPTLDPTRDDKAVVDEWVFASALRETRRMKAAENGGRG